MLGRTTGALAFLLGSIALPATAHASACRPTTTAYPGLPGSTGSVVLRLGPGGLVGGASIDSSGPRAVLWRNGRAFDLGVPTPSYVEAIDAGGDVLVNNPDAVTGHSYVIAGGIRRELRGLGGTETFAQHMDDHRDVAGDATDPSGIDHPVVWRGGSVTPTVLPIPTGYRNADAVASNDRGDLAGNADDDEDDVPRVAVVWHADGRVQVLPAAPFAGDRGFGGSLAIDDLGVVAGSSGPWDFDGRTATIWVGPIQHRAGQFLDGKTSEFFGAAAGIYVGDGTYSGTVQSGALLHAAISVAGLGPLRTLTPLSGNPRDPSSLADARLENGDVTVAGHSVGAGGRILGTVWTCALRQSFVPGRNLLR